MPSWEPGIVFDRPAAHRYWNCNRFAPADVKIFKVMRRILQPRLMRGQMAQRAAVLLYLALLGVLAYALFQGVHALRS